MKLIRSVIMDNKTRKVIRIIVGILWLIIAVISVANERVLWAVLSFVIGILFLLNRSK
ncbi:MAG: DUF373 family protein [Clostridium sp.]|nr:DUF373 family protein [Clostridium sp.]